MKKDNGARPTTSFEQMLNASRFKLETGADPATDKKSGEAERGSAAS